MDKKIQEIKASIEEAETQLKDPDFANDAEIVTLLKEEIEDLKKELEALEPKVEKAVETAEKAVEVAETKVEVAAQKIEKASTETEKKDAKQEAKVAETEKKDAKQEVKEAEEKAKEVAGLKDKAEKVEKKAKASSVLKIKKPKGKEVKPVESRKVKIRKLKKMSKLKKQDLRPKAAVKKAVAKKAAPVAVKKAPVAVKKAAPKKEASKTVRAFGQSIEYKNNAEFCKKLIIALKNRKKTSKAGGKRKTRPVFGVITNKVKDAVTQAYSSNSAKKQIEQNPRQFLAKAQRLEKSAMSFLEDFKSILGNDYKKSEITSEFRELEKYIKNLVTKLSKK